MTFTAFFLSIYICAHRELVRHARYVSRGMVERSSSLMGFAEEEAKGTRDDTMVGRQTPLQAREQSSRALKAFYKIPRRATLLSLNFSTRTSQPSSARRVPCRISPLDGRIGLDKWSCLLLIQDVKGNVASFKTRRIYAVNFSKNHSRSK